MPTALTIGTFDGVHLGHQALVRRCRDLVARPSGACAQSPILPHAPEGRATAVLALAFDPHPMTTLRPERSPARLLTFDDKRRLLLAAGATDVVRLTPDPQFLAKSAREFVSWLLHEFHPDAIVEGADFHFGKGREGTPAMLSALAAELSARDGLPACRVETLPPVDVALGDHHVARASSTLVRWLIAHGRMGDACRVLGRPYELVGEVVQGDRKGRTIGVPTCNLATECLLPMDALYAGLAQLPDGREFPAAIAVGARPTVSGAQRRAEVHVMTHGVTIPTTGAAWSPLPGLPEYGWPLRVRVLRFLRDEVKFPSFPALVEQMGRDLSRVPEAVRPATLAPQATLP